MSLMNLLVAARGAIVSRRQRQRALEELAALDDRSLADIGLHRTQLAGIVEGFHEVVELDAAPASVLPSVRRREAGLSPSEMWLHRV